MRIGKKLTISHLTITIVPLLVLAGSMLWISSSKLEHLDYTAHEGGVMVMMDQAKDGLTEEASQRVQLVHDTQKSQIQAELNTGLADIQHLAQTPAIHNLFQNLKHYHDTGGLKEDGTLDISSETYHELYYRAKPFFDEYLAIKDYYDLFLICAQHGHVLFTQAQESDLGQNLKEGHLRDEGLGRLWQNVATSQQASMVSYSAYSPSNGQAAAFIGTPYFGEEGDLKAIVALQLSPAKSNAIVQERRGLGQTGSSYLVGRDIEGKTLLCSDRKIKDGKIGDGKASDEIDLGLSGESGFAEKVGSNGDVELVAYSPINFLDLAWTLQTTIDKDEILDHVQAIQAKSDEIGANIESTRASAIRSIQVASVVILALFAVLSFGVALIISRKITGPLVQAAAVADAVAEGDLSQRLDSSARDEVGTLSRALNAMADGLKKKADLASAIADGDLTGEVTLAGPKDVFGNALAKMTDRLNSILGDANRTALQVSAGSREISDSSTTLSQGATEQAASLQEISSSMTEISNQVQVNAKNATNADQLSDQARDAAHKGVQQMQNLNSAMADINSSSSEIAKIIKVIDDIAFQTNLLALNAAVEAARAGKHGKGFAVVAEEVRNLAGRSAKAARDTAQLIEGSVARVTSGTEIASETASSLELIVDSITKASDLVGEISTASKEQAQGVSEVSQGLTQIDSVTQQNAANSEETASAAQELANHARELRTAMAKFKLRGQEYEATAHRSVKTNVKSSVTQPKLASPLPRPVTATVPETGSGWGDSPDDGWTEASPEDIIELTTDNWPE
jgi:methyl-accepting chemotaxis protein